MLVMLFRCLIRLFIVKLFGAYASMRSFFVAVWAMIFIIMFVLLVFGGF